MKRRRWSPIDTWPDLRIIIHLLPWTWRLCPRFYADELHPAAFASFEWLFLKVEWWAQVEPSMWFREDAP